MSRRPTKKGGAGGGGNVADQVKINRIKILSMGAAGCGKSCLVKRYCEERFISKYIATIGVDYGVKPVQISGRSIRVNFWDLSGHEAFFEIRNEFYKDAQGILLVYDVTSQESFDALPEWLSEATKFGANMKNIPIALCANKVDKRRVVTEEEGREFASSRGYLYFETSACTGANVTEVFEQIFQRVVMNT